MSPVLCIGGPALEFHCHLYCAPIWLILDLTYVWDLYQALWR